MALTSNYTNLQRGTVSRVTSSAKRVPPQKYRLPNPPEGHYITREREDVDRRTESLLSLMNYMRRQGVKLG